MRAGLAAATGSWLPVRCMLCMRRGAAVASAAGAVLCGDCDAALPGRGVPRCLRCALPLASPSPVALPPASRPAASPDAPTPSFCDGCRADAPAGADLSDMVLHPAVEATPDAARAGSLDAAIAAVDYAPPVDRLILALKRGQPALARPLGALAAEAALRVLAPAHRPGVPAAAAHAWLDEIGPDAIVPMPLAAAALAARGFNQSLALARPVARRLGMPLLPQALRRVRDTAPQKSLQAAGRAANLAGAFAADATIAGRRVLLVDDVMTTGATLREAAWALRQAGAAAVVGLVVARVR